MTESRQQKELKTDRARITRLTRKDKIAALELSILVLQQQLNVLTVEEFGEASDESLAVTFVAGQKVRIIGGRRRKGELCTVVSMTLKSVWVEAYDGCIFLKRKHDIVVESQAYTLKREE